jgi:RecA-family ATPase
VDVKCNGYIVVEPSIHPSGKTYSWEFSSNPLDGVVPSPLPDWLRNLQIEKQHTPSATGVERVGEGGRNDFLSRRAYALRRLGLPIDLLEQAVERLNEAHCVPPLDRAEARAIARGKAGIPSDAIVSTYISRRTEDEGLLLNLAQLEKASAAISWVVKHVIPADSVGVLFGGSGTFKSFVALDFCLHVAHGLPWLGRKTKRSPIIYIAAEGGAGLWRRIHAWHKHHKLDPKGIKFYVVPVSLDIIQNAGLVVEAAQTIGVTPGVVAVDTMSQTFSGEENSANEVAEYLRTLSNHFRYLWAAAVLVIHHSGHQVTERPRGSSAIRANVDFMYGCFRDEKQMLARLECHKQKDGDHPPELRFVLDQVKLGFDEDGDVVSSLVASYTEDEAEIEARKAAASDKSGGHEYMALGLAQPGMTVQVWRRAFYETLPKMDQPSKRKAFHRVCERLVGHDKPIDIDLPVLTDKACIVRVNGARLCQE